MKKLFTAILALSLCGVMLTACGSENTTAETEPATTTVSEAAAEVETTTATEAETTAATTEAETDAAASTSYESLDDFVKSGDAFGLDTDMISASDSLTYNWIKVLDGADSIYMDVEAIDGSMTMVMGMKEDMISMKMCEKASGTNMLIIFKDSKMYMIDEASKTGYYMSADASEMEDYDIGAVLGDLDFDAEMENAADVKVTAVEIGGEKHTFEIAETGGGFLFDKDEKLLAILSPDTSAEMTALKVNEFTGTAPDSLFEISPDYQLIDMEAMMTE